MKKVSLALGGGGARGLAHLKVLEFLDQENIPISRISGTSIGAIVGALYASGKSAKVIQDDLHRHMVLKEDRKRDVLKKVPDLLIWLKMFQFDFKGTGMVRAEKFLEFLLSDLEVQTFEDLKIPLTIIATDFWTGEEVVMDSGPLMPAVMASMAIPGVFPPVKHQGRVLVDGGLVNNVPYNHLLNGEDISIAIDVAPDRSQEDQKVPKMLDATLGMFDILIDKLVQVQRKESQPDIYLRPEIRGVRVLEFDKIDSVYEQAEAMIPELKRQLSLQGIEF
jgi:NTE family protein